MVSGWLRGSTSLGKGTFLAGAHRASFSPFGCSMLMPALLVGNACATVDVARPGRAPERQGGEWQAAQQSQPQEGLRNLLRWVTASESNNFGFYIFRAEQEEGPFQRLTREPIPGAGTTNSTSSYIYIDDAIAPGVAYFYYIESVSMNGKARRFSPTIRAKAKGPD